MRRPLMPPKRRAAKNISRKTFVVEAREVASAGPRVIAGVPAWWKNGVRRKLSGMNTPNVTSVPQRTGVQVSLRA